MPKPVRCANLATIHTPAEFASQRTVMASTLLFKLIPRALTKSQITQAKNVIQKPEYIAASRVENL